MAANSATNSDTPDWAGLAKFAELAFGTNNQTGKDAKPTSQSVANQMLAGTHGLSAMHPKVATPTVLAGMGSGPVGSAGVVAGPMMPGTAGGAVAGPMTMPGFSDGSAMMPGNKMISPVVGLPNINTNQPATADHFTTGTPNPFGNR